MNFLLDTNILVSADPTSADNIEQLTPLVAELLGLLNAGRHGIWIHPASVQELAGDKDQERREMRRLLLGKYPQLPHPPGQSARLVEVLGSPAKGSHNEIDLLLLSALDAEAVDCFVTQDDGIHRRARRTNLSDRVLRVADAMAIIRALFPTIPVPPPHVVATVAHALHDDPIFDTLRADYDGLTPGSANANASNVGHGSSNRMASTRDSALSRRSSPRVWGALTSPSSSAHSRSLTRFAVCDTANCC